MASTHAGVFVSVLYTRILTRLSRVAWPNGLRRLAEFELTVAGGRGVACGVAWLVLTYTRHFHCKCFADFSTFVARHRVAS
jgi:hypothetical protein